MHCEQYGGLGEVDDQTHGTGEFSECSAAETSRH